MLNWMEIRDRIISLYGFSKQKDLAVALGVDESVISRWMTENEKERRYPTMEIIDKVVKEKNVTWDYLLTGKENMIKEGGGNGIVTSNGKEIDLKLVNIIAQVLTDLVAVGKHVAAGKSVDNLDESLRDGLRETNEALLEILATSKRQPQTPHPQGHTA